MKCGGEAITAGGSAEIVHIEGSDNKFVGRKVLLLNHRPHEAGDVFCVEIAHPDEPGKVALVRWKSLGNLTQKR